MEKDERRIMSRIVDAFIGTGFILTLLGGAGMDSDSMVPFIMAMVGCALIWIGVKMEEHR